MTCNEFQNRLSAYMDGELSRWRRWKVELHVRGCSECADVLTELRCVDEGLAAAASAEPSRDYITGAVMFRLPAMPPPSRRRSVAPWAAAVALAGMQIAALCGAFWWGMSHGTGGTAPRAGLSAVGSPASVPAFSQPVIPASASSDAATSGVWGSYRGDYPAARTPVSIHAGNRPGAARLPLSPQPAH